MAANPDDLLPQLDELLELRHHAHALGTQSHHRVNALLCGLYASTFRGHGMEFEESREYQFGDEIRNMDWTVTARTGIPHLKVFREERERSVILCVDTGPHMRFGTRGTFKSVQAAHAASLVAWSATGNHDRVGALLFGNPNMPYRYYRPGRSRRSLWQMLRALTSAYSIEGPGYDGPRPDCLLKAIETLDRSTPTGALVFIIADLNRDPEDLERLLGRLRQQREVVLMPIDDPADHELPDIGRVVFEDPAGGRVEIDTSNPDGRRLYSERWEENRERLEQMAWRLGLDLIPVPTEVEVHRTLVESLRRRARWRVLR